MNRTQQALRINTSVTGFSGLARNRTTGSGPRAMLDDDDEMSSAASATSESDVSGAEDAADDGEIWGGDISAVIGLQKRGLRGLMEGRRARERSGSLAGAPGQRVGLGIA